MRLKVTSASQNNLCQPHWKVNLRSERVSHHRFPGIDFLLQRHHRLICRSGFLVQCGSDPVTLKSCVGARMVYCLHSPRLAHGEVEMPNSKPPTLLPNCPVQAAQRRIAYGIGSTLCRTFAHDTLLVPSRNIKLSSLC